MLFPVMQRLEISLPGQGRTQPSVIKCSKISPEAEKEMMLSGMVLKVFCDNEPRFNHSSKTMKSW